MIHIAFYWLYFEINSSCVLKVIESIRDEQMKKFFWVWTCIKPNLVLSEISEMKSEMNRSTDEENVFGSEHVSSQIWCYMKLVKRRDEEWDEQMKKIFFLVQTCIKPNLVLSEISEMKRWRVRWRDEQMKKNFFWVRTCIKPNLVLSEISEMKSEMNRSTDEENFFLGPNMYQVKSGVIWN